MLTYEEQKELADQIAHLRDQLIQYDKDAVFRDLPESLQKQLRNTPLLGPVTSSGIEHIYNVFNRLDTVVYALRSEHYQTDGVIIHRKKPRGRAEKAYLSETDKPSTNVVKHVPITRPLTQHDTSRTQKNATGQLDFGPFYPRKEDV